MFSIPACICTPNVHAFRFFYLSALAHMLSKSNVVGHSRWTSAYAIYRFMLHACGPVSVSHAVSLQIMEMSRVIAATVCGQKWITVHAGGGFLLEQPLGIVIVKDLSLDNNDEDEH